MQVKLAGSLGEFYTDDVAMNGVNGFQRELLARLPLADSVLSVLGFVFNRSFLQELFGQHRGRCYESQEGLSFPDLVDLVRDALLVHQGSGRASFQAAEERGDLPVLVGSVYQKLSRLPVELSMALLSRGCCHLGQLLPPNAPCSLPQSLREMGSGGL